MMVIGDPLLSQLGEQLLVHSVRLLSILHHALEDTAPAPTPTASSKPSLPSLQTAAGLSPIKKKTAEPVSTPVSPPPMATTPSMERSLSLKADGTATGKGGGQVVGLFLGNPFYVRLFDGLKAALNMFKTSLDNKSEERLVQYASVVLQGFSTVLEYSASPDLGRHVEEYLTYIKSCMVVTPRSTLTAVQALLRCLFKNNYPFLTTSNSLSGGLNSSSMSGSLINSRLQTSSSPSIYEAVISNPYSSFTLEHGLNIEANEMISSSSSLLASTSPFRPASKRSSERTSLASYIRLFEPMVIKALKHYTVSCQVRETEFTQKESCGECQLMLVLKNCRSIFLGASYACMDRYRYSPN
jgi:huntingtin